jgi:hypothetical protein
MLLRDLQFKPEKSERLHKFSLSRMAVLSILPPVHGTSFTDIIVEGW